MIRRAARRAVIGIALVAFVISSCGSPVRASKQYHYVIPEGTAGLIATNRAPEIFPADLTVRVGDSITIVNEDDFDQQVGPYLVKAGTTMTQHFSSPGVLQGACTMSMGGTLSVTVLPAE